MKKMIGFLFLIFCFSCDPMDGRMSFINNSNSNIHVRMLFLNKNEISESIVGYVKISKNENKIIGMMSSWESQFKRTEQGALLSVVVYKDYAFLNDKYEQSSLIKSDSLLSIGEYEYRNYSYKDLEKRDWKINYPDDGFKKGFSINLSDKQSYKNLLPSPHIIKEKGIKDGWNNVLFGLNFFLFKQLRERIK